MNNIAIIGAGNIGSRHLQGLKTLPSDTKVYVIDPFAASLATSENRWNETGAPHSVTFAQTLPVELKKIDCAIMASSADVRADATRQLLDHAEVKGIIFEKVLFQDLDDYIRIPKLLQEKNINAWVNCPRRLWPVYTSFYDQIAAPKIVHMKISGSSWGLGCNSIHMLDLLAWLSGETEYRITDHNLDQNIIESKRSGFVEFTGSFAGKFKNGSTFVIESRAQEGQPYSLSLNAEGAAIVVHEDSDHYDVNDGSGWKKMNLTIPYQSQLSGDVVNDILNTGSCALTKFSDSIALHKPMMEMFLSHLNTVKGVDSKICPIT